MSINFGKINLSKWIPLGFKIAQEIPAAIAAIQHGVEALAHNNNPQAKEDGAVEIVKAASAVGEDVLGKDLLNDPEVEAATRAATQAVITLQNVVKARHDLLAAKAAPVVQ